MNIKELAEHWHTLDIDQKRELVDLYQVMAWKRSENSWSPRHPFTGAPSRETYLTEQDAAVEQIDWLVNSI